MVPSSGCQISQAIPGVQLPYLEPGVFSRSCLVYIPAAVALSAASLLFYLDLEGVVRRRSLNGSKSTQKFSVSNGGSI